MKPKCLFLILIFISVLQACKKNQVKPVTTASDYPTPTQIGANVLAWRTDSIPYVCRAYGMCYLYDDSLQNNTGYFQIQTSLIDNQGYQRSVFLKSPDNISFPILAGTTFQMQYGAGNALFELADPATNTANMLALAASNGQIVITHFDPVKKIISGTFNFNTAPITSIAIPSRKVSDGWFDVVYYTY